LMLPLDERTAPGPVTVLGAKGFSPLAPTKVSPIEACLCGESIGDELPFHALGELVRWLRI